MSESKDYKSAETGVCVTQLVLVEDFKDGSYIGKKDGNQTMIDWAGVPVDTYHHKHLRVSELTAQLQYQYKFENGVVYVRTAQYYMTSRPHNKYWHRANIDVSLQSHTMQRLNSPDAMHQDTQWHPYIVDLSVNYNSAAGAYFRVRVEYDGTNNGVGENDSWGNQVLLVPR